MTAALTSVGVQQVTIAIASGATTGTASITAVGSGAFYTIDGWTASEAGDQFDDCNATVTISGTTLTATRGAAGTSQTMSVVVTVVAGDTTNLVKSVQTGTLAV